MPQGSKKPKQKSLYARIFGAPSGPAKAEGKPKPSDYDNMGERKQKSKGSLAEQINWPNAGKSK